MYFTFDSQGAGEYDRYRNGSYGDHTRGIVLKEIHPEFTVEQVQAATEATLIVAPDLKKMC